MQRAAYFYEGEDHIDDEYIKIIARECATCTRNYPCNACVNCKYNPAQFVDPIRAKMMRTAYSIARKDRAERTRPSIGVKIIEGLALILAIFIIISMVKYKSNPFNSSDYIHPKKAVSVSSSKTSLKSVEKEVQSVLYKVRDNIQDLNKDREINCQDYCLLFVV